MQYVMSYVELIVSSYIYVIIDAYLTSLRCNKYWYVFCETAELGDFDPRRHSPGYVSELRLMPKQTEEFERHVAVLHRRLRWVCSAHLEIQGGPEKYFA